MSAPASTPVYLSTTGSAATRVGSRCFFGIKNVTVPAAISVFPGERCQAPRTCAERAYPNLI